MQIMEVYSDSDQQVGRIYTKDLWQRETGNVENT